MKIKCPVCSKLIEVKNESGEFNGEIGKFECEHFSGSIILETKIGWFLGTNAEVKYWGVIDGQLCVVIDTLGKI